MRPFLPTLIAALSTTSLWPTVTQAHNIQLSPHTRECFHENLHKGDKMTVTFQVGDREFGGAGNLELDFWIAGPAEDEDHHGGGGGYQIHRQGVSSGDHSFDAAADGKHTYCFSNEAWSAGTKEVSFNVHGIVYVPESEAPGDPLDVESTFFFSLCFFFILSFPFISPASIVRQSSADTRKLTSVGFWENFSQTTHGPPQPSQGRTVVHCRARAHAPQYGRVHQWAREVVEYLPAGRLDRGGRLPGVVAEAVFRGMSSLYLAWGVCSSSGT